MHLCVLVVCISACTHARMCAGIMCFCVAEQVFGITVCRMVSTSNPPLLCPLQGLSPPTMPISTALMKNRGWNELHIRPESLHIRDRLKIY